MIDDQLLGLFGIRSHRRVVMRNVNHCPQEHALLTIVLALIDFLREGRQPGIWRVSHAVDSRGIFLSCATPSLWKWKADFTCTCGLLREEWYDDSW